MGGETKKDILTRIAVETNVDPDLIVSSQSRRKVVPIRQRAMAEMYATGRYSTTQIGQFFGRDHTTVLWALDAHAERTGTERPRFRTGPRSA